MGSALRGGNSKGNIKEILTREVAMSQPFKFFKFVLVSEEGGRIWGGLVSGGSGRVQPIKSRVQGWADGKDLRGSGLLSFLSFLSFRGRKSKEI